MSPMRVVLVSAAAAAFGAVSACNGSVVQGTGGGTTSASSGGSSTTSTSSSSTSSSGTWSSSSTSSSSSSSSTSASSSSSGGVCVESCAYDQDCAYSCPPAGPGESHCCGLNGCYVSSIGCNAPCEPAAPCALGSACKAYPWSCALTCACDDTGHYACTPKSEAPACPAAHPTCGDPCDPSDHLVCMCSASQGSAAQPCHCDATTSTWACSTVPSSCPPLGSIVSGTLCTDYPAGIMCDLGYCLCKATCGTQIWLCPGM